MTALSDGDALTFIECEDGFKGGRVVGPKPVGDAKYIISVLGSVYTRLMLLNLTGANPNRGSVLLVPAELYRDTSQGEQKELGSGSSN